jgi:16S rRNA (uracil1498-N3)-methyltransferase
MHIFYTPGVENNLGTHTLSEEESRHCVKVLRLKNGDTVHLVDGKGALYETEIFDADPRRCSIRIIQVIKDYNKRNFYLHIAIAPTKNSDRFEWFLEKATEIGIDEITPLLCSRSERKNLNIDRCEKVIVAAMKQSVIARKPILNKLTGFNEFIGQSAGKKYIAHCAEGSKSLIRNVYSKGEAALILIGPEGDFTPEEILGAEKNDYHQVTLGNNRLRTETAGIVACEVFNFMNSE